MSARLTALTAYRTRLPLREPYHLAFGDVTAFASVIVHVRAGEAEAWGEATPLPGYSSETLASAWAFVEHWAPALLGRPAPEAMEVVWPEVVREPFAATGLLTALEDLCDVAAPQAPVIVPLIAPLTTPRVGEIASQVEAYRAEGYTTLKLKVGAVPAHDPARAAEAMRRIRGWGHLRVDANQAYTYDEAARLAAALDPQVVDLLEQPFPLTAWDLTARLASVSPVPLMLDESIETTADIDRAVEAGVCYVKLKLMKHGTQAATVALADYAAARGLGIVLGNGVATEINCWREARLYARLPPTASGERPAGEMNGFVKQCDSLLRRPLLVERGRLHLGPAEPIPVDAERVSAVADATRRWGA